MDRKVLSRSKKAVAVISLQRLPRRYNFTKVITGCVVVVLQPIIHKEFNGN
jgi:hypothetical protein